MTPYPNHLRLFYAGVAVAVLWLQAFLPAYGQSAGRSPTFIGFQLTTGKQDLSLPLRFSHKTIYPQLEGALTLNWKSWRRVSLRQTGGIGWAAHAYNGNRLYVFTDLAGSVSLPYNWYLGGGPGVGLQQHYHPSRPFRLTPGGVYEQTRNHPRYGALLRFHTEAGKQLPALGAYTLQLFVQYQVSLQTRYHPQIPLLPYSALLLGGRLYFPQPKKP